MRSLLHGIETSHSTKARDFFITWVMIIWQAKNLLYYTVVNKSSKTFCTMWCLTTRTCFSICKDIFLIKMSLNVVVSCTLRRAFRIYINLYIDVSYHTVICRHIRFLNMRPGHGLGKWKGNIKWQNSTCQRIEDPNCTASKI